MNQGERGREIPLWSSILSRPSIPNNSAHTLFLNLWYEIPVSWLPLLPTSRWREIEKATRPLHTHTGCTKDRYKWRQSEVKHTNQCSASGTAARQNDRIRQITTHYNLVHDSLYGNVCACVCQCVFACVCKQEEVKVSKEWQEHSSVWMTRTQRRR